MRLKDFDNGLITLKDTREEAIKQNEREIAQNTYIEEIRYQIFKKDFSTSIDLAKGFLTISKNNVLNAEVAFEIGKLYNKLNEYNDAIVYFKKVSDYSPTYNLKFSSLIEQGKVLRDIGEYDKALEIFNQLSQQQKYADVLDQIDFERGETYLKMNNIDKAVDRFLYVDTSFSKSPSAGKSAYELGKIFLDSYRNFDTAAYFFNRVFSSTAPSDYINLATSSSDRLRKYEILYLKVRDNSKQLSYALDSTVFIKDSIEYYTSLEKKMKAARADSLKNKDNRISSTSNTQTNIQQQLQQMGSQQLGQQQTEQLPQGSQQQQPGQQQLTGQQQQMTGRQQSQSSQLLSQWNQLKSQSKPPVRPKTSIDTLTNELVKSEFELGNLLLFEFNIPDSAYKYYSDIMLNNPVSPFEGRVVFALGNYYMAVNDTLKADSIFNVVYDKYKDEDIVNAAAIKLNKPLLNMEYDPAKALYLKAESLMTNSNYDSSITNMYKIYLTHPKSPFAAKALFAIGWMLENKNMNDSAAVIYDTLTKEYPRSIYAANVLLKLTFYKNEIVRINKAKQDSLYALTRPKSDTLSTDSLFIKKQKLGGLVANLNGSNNTPGNMAPNNAKDENNFINNNSVINPDTLIRNLGRGLGRISR
jgi:tetratricopeptide (TPR) repeat protein